MTKKIIRALVGLFILMNVVALFHSYRFTHFSDAPVKKTKDPGELSWSEKIGTLLLGIKNPRPKNTALPSIPYEVVRLKSNVTIECWHIPAPTKKGTVIIFHGFSGNKSSMLDKAEVFRSLGYSTLVVDFEGSGGSEGNRCTIGFYEAQQVKTCYQYMDSLGEKNIYLFGTSMGAAAIMKALSDYDIQPKGLILECPFGTMRETVEARFRTMNAPIFPMASLLVFWGGIQNGFWAFGHNPVEYAKDITAPTLLMWGAKDEKVSRDETDEILGNLNGPKQLVIYPNAGHENYLKKYQDEWTGDVREFLDTLSH